MDTEIKMRSIRPKDVTPIIDHTICGMKFTDTELILTLGCYRDRRQFSLPLSRFPALAKASPEDRQRFSMHRRHSVIYWYALKEKLVAKDVEQLGSSTERKPYNVNESDFIYSGTHPAMVI
jgi:hypothetical protein